MHNPREIMNKPVLICWKTIESTVKTTFLIEIKKTLKSSYKRSKKTFDNWLQVISFLAVHCLNPLHNTNSKIPHPSKTKDPPAKKNLFAMTTIYHFWCVFFVNCMLCIKLTNWKNHVPSERHFLSFFLSSHHRGFGFHNILNL